MKLTVGQIAARLGAQLEGDAGRPITGVAGVRDAAEDEITFIAQERYAVDAHASKAAAFIVGPEWTRPLPAALIRVPKPEAAFAEVAGWFVSPPPVPAPGVHPLALVSAEATVGADVSIGPFAVVEAGAVLGDRVVIGAQCYIGAAVRIGHDSRLHPQVSIREQCVLGDRVLVHNGVVIGSDGFGYHVNAQGVRAKIPQAGIVVIGDDVEIGANTTIDRARFGKTRIGRGAKIDNLVQIAHNVIVGEDVVIVAQTGLAGSCIIGNKAIIAGQVGVAGHLTIGAGAVIGAQSGVTKDVAPGAYVIGFPATPQKQATRQHAMVARLPELRQRVEDLRKRLAALEERLG